MSIFVVFLQVLSGGFALSDAKKQVLSRNNNPIIVIDILIKRGLGPHLIRFLEYGYRFISLSMEVSCSPLTCTSYN